jgi:hypothetical protein
MENNNQPSLPPNEHQEPKTETGFTAEELQKAEEGLRLMMKDYEEANLVQFFFAPQIEDETEHEW